MFYKILLKITNMKKLNENEILDLENNVTEEDSIINELYWTEWDVEFDEALMQDWNYSIEENPEFEDIYSCYQDLWRWEIEDRLVSDFINEYNIKKYIRKRNWDLYLSEEFISETIEAFKSWL